MRSALTICQRRRINRGLLGGEKSTGPRQKIRRVSRKTMDIGDAMVPIGKNRKQRTEWCRNKGMVYNRNTKKCESKKRVAQKSAQAPKTVAKKSVAVTHKRPFKPDGKNRKERTQVCREQGMVFNRNSEMCEPRKRTRRQPTSTKKRTHKATSTKKRKKACDDVKCPAGRKPRARRYSKGKTEVDKCCTREKAAVKTCEKVKCPDGRKLRKKRYSKGKTEIDKCCTRAVKKCDAIKCEEHGREPRARRKSLGNDEVENCCKRKKAAVKTCETVECPEGRERRARRKSGGKDEVENCCKRKKAAPKQKTDKCAEIDCAEWGKRKRPKKGEPSLYTCCNISEKEIVNIEMPELLSKYNNPQNNKRKLTLTKILIGKLDSLLNQYSDDELAAVFPEYPEDSIINFDLHDEDDQAKIREFFQKDSELLEEVLQLAQQYHRRRLNEHEDEVARYNKDEVDERARSPGLLKMFGRAVEVEDDPDYDPSKDEDYVEDEATIPTPAVPAVVPPAVVPPAVVPATVSATMPAAMPAGVPKPRRRIKPTVTGPIV